jgi:hypothetical protein
MGGLICVCVCVIGGCPTPLSRDEPYARAESGRPGTLLQVTWRGYGGTGGLGTVKRTVLCQGIQDCDTFHILAERRSNDTAHKTVIPWGGSIFDTRSLTRLGQGGWGEIDSWLGGVHTDDRPGV